MQTLVYSVHHLDNFSCARYLARLSSTGCTIVPEDFILSIMEIPPTLYLLCILDDNIGR